MECKVQGKPKPTIQWYKDMTEIYEGRKYSMFVERDKCLLEIFDAKPDDTAIYECKATNKKGHAVTKALLTVKAPPKINLPARYADGVQVNKGDKMKLKVAISGRPTPEVLWFRDGRPLVPSDRVTMENTDHHATLLIDNCDKVDDGMYKLKLVNDLGSDAVNIPVGITDRPDPPDGAPEVIEVYLDYVSIAWIPPVDDGGSPITAYIVEMRESGIDEPWARVATTRGHITELTIVELKENAEYQFRVAAENLYGVSEPSEPSEPVRTQLPRVDVDYDSLVDPKFTYNNVDLDRLGRDVHSKYIILEELGRGAFGVVHRAIERATGKTWAAKFIRCPTKAAKNAVKREIDVMNNLHHPRLLQLHEAFDMPDMMVMILEFVSGGELFERLVDEDFGLTERDCIHYMRQICEGVQHMHRNDVVHLDLKPENVLCTTSKSKDIKIIDFGLAHKVEQDKSINVLFGTAEFTAPEVLNWEPVSVKTDVWSLGVVAYVLVSGLSPFAGDNDQETFANVIAVDYDFDDECWEQISPDAKDFISKCLVKDTKKRMTIEQALNHPWLNPYPQYQMPQILDALGHLKEIEGLAESRVPDKQLSTEHHKSYLARKRWKECMEKVLAIGRLAKLSAIFSKLTDEGAFERQLKLEMADHEPRIEQELNDVEAYEGTSGRFKCKISGKPVPEFHWYKAGEACLPSDKYEMVYKDNVASLYINDVEPEDAGIYTCKAVNDMGEIGTSGKLTVEESGFKKRRRQSLEEERLRKRIPKKEREITPPEEVDIPPEFTLPLMDQSIKVGENLEMAVTVTCRPEPKVTWHHNGQENRPSRRFKLDHDKGVYRIKILDVKPEDAGEWKCIGVNSLGRASCACQVTVIEKAQLPADYEAPEFTLKLKEEKIVEGSAARFDCKVKGHPQPEVSWCKDRKEIKHGRHYQMLHPDAETYQLIIQEAFPEDAGAYMCRAVNPAGTTSTEAQLKVYAVPASQAVPQRPAAIPEEDEKFEPSARKYKLDKAPEFTVKLRSKMVDRGMDVKLSCSVAGVPPPEAVWHKDGRKVKEDERHVIKNNYGLLSLEIAKATLEDAGTYTVSAMNSEGEVSCNATLDVQDTDLYEGPDFMRPSFVEPLHHSTVEVGGKATFECIAEGNPIPHFKWTKDSLELEEDDRIKMYYDGQGGAKMVIRQVQKSDQGLYYCQAQSKAGRTKCSASLRVIGEDIRSRSTSRESSREVTPVVDRGAKPSREAVGTAPKFIKPLPSAVEVPEGESLLLTCVVEGDPTPKVEWHKGARDLSYSTRLKIISKGNTHSLEVPSVMFTDGGEYKATAKNAAGEISSTTAVKIGKPKPKEPDVIAPRFIKALPDTVEIIEGESVHVNVKVLAKPPADIIWYQDGREIPRRSRHHQIEFDATDSTTLTIRDINPEDIGQYVVTATNIAGTARSSTKFVTGEAKPAEVVAEAAPEPGEPEGEPPRFLKKLRDRKVTTGNIVKLSVKVDGEPEPEITWQKNGRDLEDEGRYEVFIERDTYNLEIYDSEVGDTGTYSCTATNELGSESCQCRLIVEDERDMHESPAFQRPLKDCSVPEGSTARFDCKITGYPEPDIVWYKGSTKLTPDNKYEIIAGSGGLYSLVIRNAQVTDEGHYTCKAQSDAGIAASSAKLTVETVKKPAEAAKVKEEGPKKFPPYFIRELKSVNVRRGDSVQFYARIFEKDPTSKVKWMKDGVPLTDSSNISIFEDDKDASSLLEIQEASLSDSGNYTCIATTFTEQSTAAEEEAQTSAQLKVTDLDEEENEDEMAYVSRLEWRKQGEKPQITKTLQDLECVEGEPAVIECKLHGTPKPEVTWRKDGREIRATKGIELSHLGDTCRLKFTETYLDDEGEYSITAVNEEGSVTCKCTLKVQGAEGKDEEDASEAVKTSDTIGEKREARKTGREIAPHFIIKPRKQFIDEGQTAKFKASVEGRPAPQLTWKKDGQALQDSGKYKIHERHGFHYFEISDVTLEDAADYSCTVSNCAGSDTVTMELSVYEKRKRRQAPEFEKNIEDLSTTAGETITLECIVTGNPTPTVSWNKNHRLLRPSDQLVQSYDENVAKLVIQKSTVEDTAKYECVAKNSAGESRSTAQVTVQPKHIPPEFTKHLKSMTVLDGDTVILECKVTGFPTPDVHWEMSGKIIQPSRDHEMQFDGETAILKINEAFPEDTGEYVCIASNEEGKDQTKAVITVNEDESTTPVVSPRSAEAPVDVLEPPTGQNLMAPIFLKHLEDATANDGDRVELVVRVTGTEPIDIVWVHNGKEISPEDKDFKVLSEGDEHKLVISDIFPDDGGEYVCEAYNAAGDANSACNLTVTGSHRNRKHKSKLKPKSGDAKSKVFTSEFELEDDVFEGKEEPGEPFPPDFLEVPKSQCVEEGTGATFRCRVTGVPIPNVQWKKDGKIIESGGRFKVSKKGDMLIFDIPHTLATDAGSYTIVLENSEGDTSYTVNLEVEPLHDVEHTDYNSLIKSRPHLSTIGDQSSTDSDKDGESVRAARRAGKRVPEFISTLQDKRVAEGDTAVLECTVSAYPEPVITWSVDRKEIKESKYFQTSFKDNIARLVILEAYPEDEGLYMCTANNSLGSANCKCELFVEDSGKLDKGPTVASAPKILEPPLNVSVKRGRKFQLRAKISSLLSPQISWYKGKEELKTGGRVRIDVKEDSTALIVTDSTSEDSGKYRLVVANKDGDAQATASVTVEDVPDPPGQPVASDIFRTELTLSWSGPPFDGGSIVANYKIEMCKAKDRRWKVLTAKCESTCYRVTDLVPETEYLFRVSAENKHGLSEPSQASDIIVTFERRASVMSDFSCFSDFSCISDFTEYESEDELPFEPREVVIDASRKFSDSYETLEELGKGRFGNVHRVIEKSSGREFAAKFIKCRPSEKENIKQEVNIMNRLKHNKLLMLWDAYEEARRMIMVMEYIGGGELFERIIDDDFELTEKDCIHFMRQICDGVRHMHEQNILHLDLKPENILCIHKHSNQIKIIDFGLARPYDQNECFKVLFGTPEFIAPEVISYDHVTPATDMWSVGVICYILLSGLSPFMGDNDAETLASVTRAEWDFDDDSFDEISDNAKEFITKLLLKRPEKRMSVHQCIDHPWLAQDLKSMRTKKLKKEKLKRFLARRKWQVEEMVKKSTAAREMEEEEELGVRKMAPKFIKEMSDCTAFVGDSARFDCKVVTGTREADVHWFKDGKEIRDDPHFQFQDGSRGAHSLIIRNVSPSDSGEYECRVVTATGEVSSCEADLKVKQLPGSRH
ncbi:titin homolog isoform X2 [Lingula anatina]|uniref:Myosin light chain kinase, smooth muscle n=1 Tax=Lingula anatina TaxID=7574 RepID=A0A1S3KAT9_LINAN|nr:titin homolog isoform X2 [Lingula anatina]|eukprot:XP_013419371.1 titin homolog isoform X2 [Lingula anatina]